MKEIVRYRCRCMRRWYYQYDECPSCSGQLVPEPVKRRVWVIVQCRTCEGEGRIYTFDDFKVCPACGGKGTQLA